MLVLVAAYLYVAVLKTLYAAIERHSKPERELSRDDLDSILKSLNVVVGDKAMRFASYLKNCTSQNNAVDPAATFDTITQPKQQIALLISAVRGAFECIDSADTLYRVGLLIIRDGKPVEWAHFDPADHPPRTPPTDLSHPGSTVMHAVRARTTVIVEDIARELRGRSKNNRRYVRGNTRDDDEGSQLCYPVIHPATGQVEYVITVTGDGKCCMPEKHRPLYEWIINHYALRLNLEHSLMVIKERASHDPIKTT